MSTNNNINNIEDSIKIELLGLINDKLSDFPSTILYYQLIQGDLLFLESHSKIVGNEILDKEIHP